MKKIKELSKLLLKRNLSIITVESCTGGLFASQLNSLPGSSNFFEFGIVCYSNTSKEKILKIPKKQILKHGAVSEQISNMMNDNIKSIFDVNAKKHVIVSITGIAGPSGGSVIKPIGTTYITINYKKKINYHKVFDGDNRKIIQNNIVQFSIDKLFLEIKKLSR